nr:MAG: 128 KDa putative replicase [Opuntia virus 2]
MALLQAQVNSIYDGSATHGQSLIKQFAERRVHDEVVESAKFQDRRPKYVFSRVISQDATRVVTDSYPEFRVSFSNTVNSVHPLAGGLRGLELEWMMMQVPFGHLTYDIGGTFSAHLLKGRDYVHCCSPALSMRDLMRYQSQAQSLECYMAKRHTLPEFQRPAFELYSNSPRHIHCFDRFQECTLQAPDGVKPFAVALHSLYDIPVEEFAPALLRKNVECCYAAFHFSEDLLLDEEFCSGELDPIGGRFERDGDRLSFYFKDESTLVYEHSFKNVIGYVLRTFFVASSRYVYMKEAMCTRVNTMFMKFVKVDTFQLHRSCFSHQIDTDALISGMNDSWELKRSLMLQSASRNIFKDKAKVHVWFPGLRNKLLVPIFRGIVSRPGKVKKGNLLIDAEFFHTVSNHVRTYQGKQLTYESVLSLIESLRSRIVINGTTVRSEWQLDKSVLQDFAMSIFLITQLKRLQDEQVLASFKNVNHDMMGNLKATVSEWFKNSVPNLFGFLLDNKLIVNNEKKLEVRVPDEYRSFEDYCTVHYGNSCDRPDVSVDEVVRNSDTALAAASVISEISSKPAVDLQQFMDFCNEHQIDAMHVATILKGLEDGVLGISMKSSVVPDVDPVKTTVSVDSPSASTPTVTSELVPLHNEMIGEYNFWFPDEDGEPVDLNHFHGMSATPLLKVQKAAVIYRGSVRQRQMLNFLDYLSATLCATTNNLKLMLQGNWKKSDASPDSRGLYDCINCKWILPPPEKGHCWGVVVTTSGEFKIVILHYENNEPIVELGWKTLAVSSDTKLFTAMKQLSVLRACLHDNVPPEPLATVTLIDGVPGCGKSKEIIESADLVNDLVLTPGREAVSMLRRRFNSHYGRPVATKENVRTIDSFTMNPKPRTFKTLWIDEGLMVHPGLINFCIVLSQASSVKVFGDRKQIPFISRVFEFDYPLELRNIVCDSVENRDVTRRCPLDITSFLAKQYDRGVLSTSSVSHSVSVDSVKGAAVFDPVSKPLEGKIVTFTQSDKLLLQRKGYKDVNTVHEIQGETFPKVHLVRATSTPISIISQRDKPHIIVALSRHTQCLVYHTVVQDVLCSVIKELSGVGDFLLELYSVSSGSI